MPAFAWQFLKFSVLVGALVSAIGTDPSSNPSAFEGPPTEGASLVGNWFGLASGDLFLYRIRLDTNGGLVARDYAGRAAKLWPVAEWNVQGEKLVIRIGSGGDDKDLIGIHGEVRGSVIRLAVDGASWTHEMTLYRESELLSRIERLRIRMEVAQH